MNKKLLLLITLLGAVVGTKTNEGPQPKGSYTSDCFDCNWGLNGIACKCPTGTPNLYQFVYLKFENNDQRSAEIIYKDGKLQFLNNTESSESTYNKCKEKCYKDNMKPVKMEHKNNYSELNEKAYKDCLQNCPNKR